MKKICLAIVMFFSFCFVTFASEVKISFNKDFKDKQTITAKTNEIIQIPIYFESEEFDLYALLADLEYDKEHLELIDHSAESDFTITLGNRLLADRYGDDLSKSGKMLLLNFKVKKNDKSTISLKNVTVADDQNVLDIIDVEITINSVVSNNTIYYISIGVLLVAAVGFIMFSKNKKINKKK